MSDATEKGKFVESAHIRYKRYEKARERMDLWLDLFEDAYKFAIPDRNDFFDKSVGSNRMNDVFDSTAIDGVQDYASNIQSLLTPPYTRWAKLVPGDLISQSVNLTDDEKKEVQETLEKYTETLFNHLDASNFILKSNESLQDLSVSTGIMVLNEGDDSDPFKFLSIPISQVAVSEGPDGTLENFWRKWNVAVRLVPQMWPTIELPQDLQSLLANNPDEKVQLIEGCIRYQKNAPDDEYYYYVQSSKHSGTDLMSEWRNFNPFFGFRGNVSPGEILGRGPTLKVLPDIKVLNKLKEMTLRGASMRAFPIVLVDSNAVVNPNEFKLTAGDSIVVEPSVTGKDPIRPMQVGGDVQFGELMIQDLQATIKNAHMTDPLGPPQETVNQTATQTQIRQQNWIRKSAAVFGRLTREWLDQVLDKSIRILRKKNLLQDIEINGKQIELKIDDKTIGIEYASPLLDIQKQDDAQRLEGHIQFIGENFGPTGIAATYDLAEIPIYMADKMGVPSDLINDKSLIEQKLGQLAQQAQQAAQAQAQAGQPPLPAGQAGPVPLPAPPGGEQEPQ